MNALGAVDVPYTIEVLDESEGLPLVIQARADTDPVRLASWIAAHRDWLRQCLIEHGALLFRGFAVESAPTFERVVRAIDDCTFADGTDIPDADMEAIREAVWRHMVVFPWQRGDIVAIDNYAVSHGRLPYQGPRQVAVCWA